jgi:polysaccharide chain length determinant protein (PEP-CTERM system associated)
MLGHRAFTIDEYVEILRRRYLIILCCAITMLGAGIGLSHFVKPVYESQTLILIEQQKVPENYVKPVVAEDLDAQLASMKEQILSRSRLEPIITRYNLFAADNRQMDDRIALTRNSINVTQIHSQDGRGGMPGFFVSFDANDPHTAQLVCGEITSLFVSANLNAREQSAEGTNDFLKQQLDDAKRTLDEQDAKLADFEEKYLGRLPDQEASNTNTLQALTAQLDSVTQSISQLQQNESFLQTMISQQTHQQEAGAPSAVEMDQRQKELQSLIEQKKQLDELYTPDYPDVIEVSRKIAELQVEMKQKPSLPASKNTSAVPSADSPQLQQLRAQLHAIQQSLILPRQEQLRIQQQIRMYESRIEQSPQVEEQYKSITRDHDTALQFYNSLLTKMNESSMATALEQRQQGEQFSVMDPANLPESPKFPNPTLFATSGALAGLAFGVLIVALLEYLNTAIRNETDIRAFTELPTLAVIAYIDNLPQLPSGPSGVRRRFSRKQKTAESVGA